MQLLSLASRLSRPAAAHDQLLVPAASEPAVMRLLRR